jgi:hypothetical protein
VRHVGPAREEHVVGARALLPRSGDLEVLDVELDPDLPEHGRHRLGDLELLRVEVLHEDEVEREVGAAGLFQELARLLRIVRFCGGLVWLPTGVGIADGAMTWECIMML